MPSTSSALTCPNCQRENSAGRRYCGGCGQGLWESCPQCGRELPLDERYCGQCGGDVRGIVQEQRRQLEVQLETAGRLAREHRYDDALATLQCAAAVSNPSLEALADQARSQLARLEAERRQAMAEAAAAKTHAAELIQQRSYDWARKVLENIPSPLRDDEADTLLEQARFSSSELMRLVAEIKETIEQKQTWELFPKIERVLALKPDHAAVLALAGKLRDQFVAGARKRLAEHRYDDARQLLLQIPPFLRQEEAAALLDEAQELSALLADLKRSPYATPQALELAKRLVKLAPTNADAAALCRQLEQRCGMRSPDPRLAMPPWARPPAKSALGIPVDWLGHFTRAEAAATQVAQTVREHPGELFVALGLALQGLDEVPIDASLMPPVQGGVLVKLATMPLLSRGPSSAWGIDLGGYALKALKLARDASGQIKVEDCQYILLNRPLGHPDADPQRLGILSDALADLASRDEFKGSRVVAALPGHRVLGRFFALPALPARKVAAAVEYEARHQLPIGLDELCWDWKPLHGDEKPTDDQPRPVMVMAARRAHVEERLSLFKSAGIAVDEMQSDCLALHNALRFELGSQKLPAEDAIAIVDVGADEANLVISAADSVWFRTFGLGGHEFNVALTQSLKLTYENAERAKRHPDQVPRYHELRSALAPLLVQFHSEVERSLASYQRQGSAEVNRLYAVGGGARLHGLLRHLRES